LSAPSRTTITSFVRKRSLGLLTEPCVETSRHSAAAREEWFASAGEPLDVGDVLVD
jgi:hypothetical protein